MKRRHFLSGIFAATALPGLALAQDFVASVIAQLRKQGFRSVIEERTLLGRVRLTATRGDGAREIIINPRNGEILRDLWTPTGRSGAAVEIIEDKSGASGRDKNDSDDNSSSGNDGGSSGGDTSGGDAGSGGNNSGGDAGSGGNNSGGDAGSGGNNSGGGSNDDDDDDDDDDD